MLKASLPDDINVSISSPTSDVKIKNQNYLTGARETTFYIDEFRISRGLRYTDIFIVPSTVFISDVDTAALWHFDEPMNSVIFADASSHGNSLFDYNGARTRKFGYQPSPWSIFIPVIISSTIANNENGWFLYSGEWQGTFSGTDRGTWNVSIDNEGHVSGSGYSNDLMSSFNLKGKVDRQNQFLAEGFASGGASTGAAFIGTVVAPGKVTEHG